MAQTTLYEALSAFHLQWEEALQNNSKRIVERLERDWQTINNNWDVYLQAKAEGDDTGADGAIDNIVDVLGGDIDISVLPAINGTYAYNSLTASITASTTQTQGEQPLITNVNEISVCANANDVVTLPAATSRSTEIFIINNGAETLQIFPASGDNLGGGVDASTTLAAGSNITFVNYDATNWEIK